MMPTVPEDERVAVADAVAEPEPVAVPVKEVDGVPEREMLPEGVTEAAVLCDGDTVAAEEGEPLREGLTEGDGLVDAEVDGETGEGLTEAVREVVAETLRPLVWLVDGLGLTDALPLLVTLCDTDEGDAEGDVLVDADVEGDVLQEP